MAAKLEHGGPDNAMLFWCPGCETNHAVWCDKPAYNGSQWQWNGDLERPTVSPSILVQGTVPMTDDEHARIMAGEEVKPTPFRCHLFIRNGTIEYLGDCTHRLAGLVVGMEDVEP